MILVTFASYPYFPAFHMLTSLYGEVLVLYDWLQKFKESLCLADNLLQQEDSER